MECVIATSIENLYAHCKGHDVKIYGAKADALKTCEYLEERQVNVSSFIVSNLYKNPVSIYSMRGITRKVIRIEEVENKFDCIVIAVSSKQIPKVRALLEKYNINKIIIFAPTMNNDASGCLVLSNKCNVSPKAVLAQDVQIICDNDSSICIGDYVFIKSGTTITAMDGATILLGSPNSLWGGVSIGKESIIYAENGSSVCINDSVSMEAHIHIIATNNSKIGVKNECEVAAETQIAADDTSSVFIGNNCRFDKGCSLVSTKSSETIFSGANHLGEFSRVNNTRNGKILIGKATTFNPFLYLGCERSIVNIGEDNMFSTFIKINVGSHKIINKEDEKDFTNYNPIYTGTHVWVGMGSALLPGCNIGDGSIIGANSIVNKNIPKNVTCAGNPLKVIRHNIEWKR